MKKFIRFKAGEEEVQIDVTNIYANFDGIRTVLTITTDEALTSYDEVKKLRLNKGMIGYYEDFKLKTEYEGYTLGGSGCTINSKEPTITVMLERADAATIEIEKLEDRTAKLKADLGDIEQAIIELSEIIYQ